MSWKPISNTAWEQQLDWFKDSSQYRALDTIDGEPMEFEWDVSQDSLHWSLFLDVQKFMSNTCEPEQFQGRIIFMSMLTFAERQTPSLLIHEYIIQRVLKCKGGRKLSFHFCADGRTIETVFRTIISVNQLSIHGAVLDVCEEYSTCQTRTERLVVAEQSDPLLAPADLLTTTLAPSIEAAAQENLLQKHKERVEKLPQTRSIVEDLY